VYDLTNRKSLFEVKDMIDLILRVKDCEKYPIVLVGNKSDLQDSRDVTQKDLENLYDTYWKFPHIETSAKLRLNVDECFEMMVKELRRSNENSDTKKKTKKKGNCNIL
jgi:GTPase KRas